jgi:hypothetical protein
VRVTGTLTTAKVVTGPSYSKTYTVVNAATGGIVTFKASGQTGVSIAVGESAFVYFNGTDYVKVSGTVAVASFQTSLGGLTPSTATTGVVTLAGTLNTTSGGTGLTSFTAGDVPYYASGTLLSKLAIGTAGQFLTSTGTAPQWSTLSGVAVTTFSAGTTGFTPSSATSGAVTLAGTLATTNGGTGLTSFTSGGVVYASSSSALATGSGFTYDATTFLVTGTSGIVQTLKANSGAPTLNLVANTQSNAGYGGIQLGDGTNWNWTIGGGLTTNVMTFSINSSEQMRLTSTGLGIGTSSPSAKLSVTKASNYDVARLTAPDLPTLDLYQSAQSNAAARNWRILTNYEAWGQLDIQVGTTSADAPSVTRLSLTSSGNLGIGTSSPSAQLQLNKSGTGDYSTFRLSNSGASGKTYEIGVGGNTSASGYANNLYFYDSTAAALRMVLDTSGNVGIGTSSPIAKLDVQSGWIRTANGTSTSYFGDGVNLVSSASASSSAVRFDGDSLLFSNSTNERARITSGGDFGLGTTSPNAKLAIGVAAATVDGTKGVRITNSGGGIVMLENGSNNDSYVGTLSASDFCFRTNNTEKVRITSAGLVGIGTSSPNRQLELSTFIAGAPTGTGFVGGALRLSNLTEYESNYGTGGGNPDFLGSIEFYAGDTSVGTGVRTAIKTTVDSYFNTNSLCFYTAPANTAGILERMRLDSGGYVGIGTSSPTSLLSVGTLGTSSNPAITIGSATNSSGSLYFGDGTGSDTYRGYVEYAHVSDALLFGTASTERMRIRSDGRLLINSTALLDYSTINYNGTVQIATQGNAQIACAGFASGADYGGEIILSKSNTNTVGSNSIVQNNDKLGTIFFAGANGTGYSFAAHIRCIVNGTPGASADMPGALLFSTSSDGSATPTERARITSGGYFKASNSGNYVGATSNYHELVTDDANTTLYVASTNASPNGVVVSYRTADPNGTVNQFIYCEGNGSTQRMSVRSNGGIANYSANDVNLSDRREKTNFAPAASYLDKICAIPVQTFNYIDQNMEDDDGLTLGVIAQDVQAVAPELVMESNWASKDAEPKMRLSIYQTDLQYALMKCIQEQQAIIESLKARLDAANL